MACYLIIVARTILLCLPSSYNFVLFLSNKLPWHLRRRKQWTFGTPPVGQESGRGLANGSGPCPLWRLHSGHWRGLHSSEGLGGAGVLPSALAHSDAWHISACCLQKASVSCCISPKTFIFESQVIIVRATWVSPRSQASERRQRGRAWRKPQYPPSGSTPEGRTSKNVWTYFKTTTAYDIKYCLLPSVLCLGSESISDPSDLFHFLSMNRRWLSEFLVSTSLFPVSTSFLFPCIR